MRGLGHHLSPIVMLGKEGISDTVLKSVEEVLIAHELVKMKIQDNCPIDRQEAAKTIADRTGAALVQIIGKMFLLFRENQEQKEDHKIKLPV